MDCKHIARLILLQPIFLISFFIFILNEIDFNIAKPSFIIFYLNDVLAPIIILTISQFILSIYLSRIYLLSKAQNIFFFLYITFIFEIVLPYFSVNYTSDFYDVVAYAIGTVIFYNCTNKKLNELERYYKAKEKC